MTKNVTYSIQLCIYISLSVITAIAYPSRSWVVWWIKRSSIFCCVALSATIVVCTRVHKVLFIIMKLSNIWIKSLRLLSDFNVWIVVLIEFIEVIRVIRVVVVELVSSSFIAFLLLSFLRLKILSSCLSSLRKWIFF